MGKIWGIGLRAIDVSDYVFKCRVFVSQKGVAMFEESAISLEQIF